MNILFPTLGSAQWTGGITYIINLCKAARLADPTVGLYHYGQFRPELYDGKLQFDGTVAPRPEPWWRYSKIAIERLHLPLNSLRHYSGPVDAIDVGFSIYDRMLQRKLPVVQWIADFQHIHLKEFFTLKESVARDEHFLSIAKTAPLVILSSEDARADFVSQFPDYAHKARVLNFVVDVPEHILRRDAGHIVDKYHLPQRYFYLPNQFWKHKNHQVVIEAVALLRARGISVDVVMTGHTHDYRNPKYFDYLLQLAAELGVGDSLHFLGLVPLDDVLFLMKRSACVLNPSLFEGWSTIVEEAKAMRKPVILSDLGVHREQAPELGMYFDRSSPQDLAGRMAEALERPSLPDVSPEELIAANHEAQRRFGARFLQICDEALALA